MLTKINCARVHLIESLKNNRQTRNKHNSFYLEGVTAINSMFSNNWKVKTVIYSPEQINSRWATAILDNVSRAKHLQVSTKVLQYLSDKQNVSELLFIVEKKKHALYEIPLKINFNAVLFDRPNNPGNLGTIIRTSNSFGINALLIIGHSVDVYSPETIRASIGTIFSLPVVYMKSQNELIEWLKKVKRYNNKFQILGTSAHSNNLYFNQDLSTSTLYILGNETAGMSEILKTLCDCIVSIPTMGSSSSLNVTAAAAIILAEAMRQRISISK